VLYIVSILISTEHWHGLVFV